MIRINLAKTNKLFLAGVVIAILAILGFSIFGLVKAINSKKEAKIAINMQNEIDDETHIEEGIVQEEEINIDELGEYVPEEENNEEQNNTQNNTVSSNSNGTSSTNKKTTNSGKKYYIKVNNSANVVTVYTQDENGEYTVPVKVMVCSTGTATPKSGKYGIKGRWEWLGLFGNVYGHYSTQIVGNILFHSVPYLEKYNPGSLEYWEYDKLGTSASMGCIRLTVRDARWIFNNVSSGTIVEFYSSSNPGPLGKPSAQKISGNEKCRNWDPTDSNPNNPWHSYKEEKPKEPDKKDDKKNNVNQNTDKTNSVNNNVNNSNTNNATVNNSITNNNVDNKINNTANNVSGNNTGNKNNVISNNTTSNNNITNNTSGNNKPNKNNTVNNVVDNTTNNNLKENNITVNNATNNNSANNTKVNNK